MLRPATPLSILFFVAFVLLLLSTLSTPLIKSIPLATYRGVHFGVLGYCENGDSGCKGPMIGYNTGMCCYTTSARVQHKLTTRIQRNCLQVNGPLTFPYPLHSDTPYPRSSLSTPSRPS